MTSVTDTMYGFDLDPDDPEDVERFTEDQKCCYCDMDYQCFNPECRERVEKEWEYYARFFANPTVHGHYQPTYGYEGGIRYKIEYEDA